MEQPEGYVAPGKKDWVWRLKKGLYWSVQAGRTWNEELNAHTESEGFTATARNQRFTSKTPGRAQSRRSRILGGRLRHDREWEGARYPPESVDTKYGITGPGEVRWVLGMLLERDRSARTIAISQEAFVDSILARFNLLDATTVTMPLTSGSHLLWPTAPSHKTRLRKWRPARTVRLWEHSHGLPLGLARISHSPPVHSPASDITLVASLGKRSNESYVTSSGL